MAAPNTLFIADTDSLAWDSQTELSGLDSAQFDDFETDSISSSSQASTPSAAFPAIPPGRKPHKIRAKNTWAFARAPRDNEEANGRNWRRYFYCKECPYWRDTITSNIRLHLLNKHQLVVQEAEPTFKKDTKARLKFLFQKQHVQQTEKLKERKEQILRECVSKPVVQEALAQLIVMRNLPYEAATWPELRALLLSVNYTCENALVNSGSSIPSIIERSYILDKAVLKTKLQESLSIIHLAVDVWSSPNRKSFLAIVAHFVDNSSILRKALIALPCLLGKHGGDEQAEALWRVLQDYNSAGRIGYIVGDDHGSNDKLLRRLATKLQGLDFSVQFDPLQHRIRCHGHVLNLAAQAFFFCEDKEAVDKAFKDARAALECDTELAEAKIEELLAKKFKRGKVNIFPIFPIHAYANSLLLG